MKRTRTVATRMVNVVLNGEFLVEVKYFKYLKSYVAMNGGRVV